MGELKRAARQLRAGDRGRGAAVGSPGLSTELGRGGLRRGRRVWTLAAVEADAFWKRCGDDFWFAPWWSTRVVMALQLAVGDRHVAEDGSAVVMLGRGAGAGGGVVRRAAVTAVALLVAVVVLAVAAGPVAPVVLAVALVAAVLRPAPRLWGERRVRARLRAVRPEGARLVHSLARARWAPPGRGAALMAELHRVADRNGWPLVLETASARLVAYYTGLGYEVVGEERMPSGGTRWAMVRSPGKAEVVL